MSTVRFAPSPTGSDIHPGNLRIAALNHLFAIKYNSKLILRIEDTLNDRVMDSSSSIIESLPSVYKENIYYQSDNKERHVKLAESLIGKYAYIKDDAVWFRKEFIPDCFFDGVYGKIVKDPSIDKDFVIIRGNGEPSFIFANAIDDMDMGVTDVIRGCDHLQNTLKQIGILSVFGYSLNYYHISMIVDKNKKPLSKRDLSGSVHSILDMGIDYDALYLYLACMGGKQYKSIEEAALNFDIHRINKSPVCFDLKALRHFNRDFLKVDIPLNIWDVIKEHCFTYKDVSSFKYLWERPLIVECNKEILKDYLITGMEKTAVKWGKREAYEAVRLATCGSKYSLDLDLVRQTVGECEFYLRIKRYV